jgi:hypothetical protein
LLLKQRSFYKKVRLKLNFWALFLIYIKAYRGR